jgi:hypothetical protein
VERTERQSLHLKSPNLGNLAVDASSLYLLAAPSTPDEAREAVIERSERGETRHMSKSQSAMIDERLTKTTGALLVAMHAHVKQLVGGKHVDAGQLRLTVAARQAEAKKLVGAGLSLRETAKKLGVGKSTVQEDVSGKRTNTSENRTPKPKPSPSKPPDPEEERKQSSNP